jgi:hypothetical protein
VRLDVEFGHRLEEMPCGGLLRGSGGGPMLNGADALQRQTALLARQLARLGKRNIPLGTKAKPDRLAGPLVAEHP